MTDDFDYDLFISYAHTDNELKEPFDKYVWHFVESLCALLKVKLGGDPIRVYLDKAGLQANHVLTSELLNAVQRSRLFLAFASPAYHKRPWTRGELSTFMSLNPDPRRVFVVELGPTKPGGLEEIEKRFTMRLYEEAPVYGGEPILLKRSGDPFAIRVNDLAGQMRDQLERLRSTNTAAPNRVAVANAPMDRAAATGPRQKTVLLAQVTDDLEEDRIAVLEYLKQAGIQCLPKEDYPQGANEFEEAFKADLVQCEYFVQLLGQRPGKKPRDMKVSYGQLQADLAQSASVATRQWRRRDLVVDAVEDPDQRKLLLRGTVRSSTLEEFKADLVEELTRPEPTPAPLRNGLFLLVNTDEADRDAGRRMKDELGDICSVALPMEIGNASVQGQFVEDLIECDAMIVLYGGADPIWIHRQMKYAHKVRSDKGKLPLKGALCYGPPSEKPDPNFIVQGMKNKVDCSDASGNWSTDNIRSLIAEWSQ